LLQVLAVFLHYNGLISKTIQAEHGRDWVSYVNQIG
jgi:hypothetical protein